MYNYKIVIYAGQDLAGLTAFIDELVKATESFQTGGVSLSVFLDAPPYELMPGGFAVYLDESARGTEFFDPVKPPEDAEDTVYIHIRPGTVVDAGVLKYLTYFFEDSGCSLAFIPVLSGKEKIPAYLTSLPPGGITGDYSLLLRRGFVCAQMSRFNPMGSNAAMAQAAASAGSFGILNMVSCMIYTLL